MKNKITESLFLQHRAEEIIKTLRPYLTQLRQQRIESVIQYRLNSITLAIENPADINNALACIRTAEALGVSTVHIISPEHDTRYIHTITQSAFYWINIVFHADLNDFLNQMKKEKKHVTGAILNAQKSLSALSIEQPMCILLGNEKRGLSEAAKNACDSLFSIPMRGMVESLNLSVAAAIALFNITEKKRNQLQNQTDLSEKEKNDLRAKYYLNSVETRVAEQLFRLKT